MRAPLSDLISLIRGRSTIWKGVAYLVLLRAIQIGMGIGSTYFLVRSLSKDAFGEYHFVLNAVGILTLFGLSGLNNALMQAVARGFHGTYRTAMPIAFFTSFAGAILLVGLSGFYYWRGADQIDAALLLAAVLFPFAHGLTQWKSVIMGRQRFELLLAHDGIASLIVATLVTAAALYFPGNYWLPVVAVLGIPALQNITLTAVCLLRLPSGAPVEAQNVVYGIKTTFYASLGNLGNHLDRVLLFYFLSPATLATYTAADRIPELLRSGVQDISAVLAPRFATHGHFTQRLDRTLAAFSVLYGIIIVIFAFTLMPFIVRFIFGTDYADAIPYAQALACSVALGSHASLRFRFIRSRMDVKGFRDIMLVTTAVRFAAFLTLVPWFGLTGAVASVFIYRLMLIVSVGWAIAPHREA